VRAIFNARLISGKTKRLIKGGTALSRLISLLSLLPLAVFVYFQILSLDNPFFTILTFSSFLFTAVGTVLLYSASNKTKNRGDKITVYTVTSIFIIALLLAGYSLATIPRGGIKNTFNASPSSFQITASYHETPVTGVFSGSNYPYETIYIADYPVGWVLALAYWDFTFEITADRPLTMDGTIYTALMFNADAGTFYETRTEPISFNNETTVSSDVQPEFWGWGTDMPTSRRVRVNGYTIELWVSIWMNANSSGPDIRFTITPDGQIQVSDYQVDSILQNFTAITLSNIFVAMLLGIVAKPIKPKLDPFIIKAKQKFIIATKTQPTTKAYFKNCVKCSQPIPLAADECQHCGAKQA
jgi:hypothetical protein